MTAILGVDIGGTGIRGAPVDVERGELLKERHEVETPAGARPEDVADEVLELVTRFDWRGPIGCAFPAVIRSGVACTAVNIDAAWRGADVGALLSDGTGRPVRVLNDADAAGLAEMRFGAGKGRQGVVVVLTLGTGIGSALFFNGQLIPNTELAHLEIGGQEAQELAAGRVRREAGLSWREWAKRVNEVLARIEVLVPPDLIIVGGGVSQDHAEFLPLLKTRAEIVPARFRNDAGIVGAAYFAAHTAADGR